MQTPHRVVLLNVKYSPNLGDGLLSECLEYELSQSLPNCQIESVDLAGRTAYPRSHNKTRGIALKILDLCPPLIRNHAADFILTILISLRLQKHYQTGLMSADAVIVGGGNLFSDADLNFPKKIASALFVAKKQSIPVAVYGVGVSSKWSTKGTKLFEKALQCSQILWTSVRDKDSRKNWSSHFKSSQIPLPKVVIDPGVLASLRYPRCNTAKQGKRIGFCITDPLAVRYHSDKSSAASLDEWYPDAIRTLAQNGYEVSLFTNGSPEDREYLNSKYEEWIRMSKGPVTISSSFSIPEDMATFISSCDLVIAHRMHACIAAYSFGVPAIGLQWDAKLNSFFDVANQSDQIIDPATFPAHEITSIAVKAMQNLTDPTPLIAQAQSEIRQFAHHLSDFCASNDQFQQST